jgi:hypothetical protein
MFHEVKHEDMWFLVSNMEIQKPSQELHFEVTKKHTCLLFHIHVFNLFKSWWNQGFDQDSNGYKNSKKKQGLLMLYSKHSINLINKV